MSETAYTWWLWIYTLTRILIGLLFVGHGVQKLFGLLGGKGLGDTVDMMRGLGMRPARVWALAWSAGEMIGGAMLTFGFLTPVGAALIIMVMLIAIAQIHAPRGVWIAEGGFEYNLVLIANMLMFGLGGPGALAVDNNLTYPITLQEMFGMALIGTLLIVVLALALAVGPREMFEIIRNWVRYVMPGNEASEAQERENRREREEQREQRSTPARRRPA